MRGVSFDFETWSRRLGRWRPRHEKRHLHPGVVPSPRKEAPTHRRVTPALRIVALTLRIVLQAYRMVTQVHRKGAIVLMCDVYISALKDYNSASVFLLLFSKLMRAHQAYHRTFLELVDASDSASKAGFCTLNFGLVNTSYSTSKYEVCNKFRIQLLKLMPAPKMLS